MTSCSHRVHVTWLGWASAGVTRYTSSSRHTGRAGFLSLLCASCTCLCSQPVTSLGKRDHTPPCSSEELFFAERKGVTKEHFRGFHGCLRVFASTTGPPAQEVFPEASKVFQMIFFRWWQCTHSSLLTSVR